MKLKFFRFIFLLTFYSCGEQEQPEEQEPLGRHFRPNLHKVIHFINISEKNAKDLNFWENYHLESNMSIFPIQNEIRSDTWKENGNILIAINALFAVVKNVEMFNTYKGNLNTFNKLLFFIAHAINNGQNISKYEFLFCQEFKRLLKNKNPDEYEILLKNPIMLEKELQKMVVEEIKESNPESIGKIGNYMYVQTYADVTKLLVREFGFIPDKDEFVDGKYHWLVSLIFIENVLGEKQFEELLIRERRQYLQTEEKPKLDSIKTEIEKIFERYKRLLKDKQLTFIELNDKKCSLESINELIHTGRFYGWFDYGQEIPEKIEDRFFIHATDGPYNKTFGNKNIPNIEGLYINLDQCKIKLLWNTIRLYDVR